jgi:septum formation protein
MREEPLASIILASSSPRRKKLLAQAGFKFRVAEPAVDESVFPAEGLSSDEYAKNLALAKAESVAQNFPDYLVIGADTVADFNGRIIGKPADAQDAEQIIKKLFSAPHKVITAVALVRLSDGTRIVDSDVTTVYPRKMSAAQIAEHIKGGSWQGKAGAYAIQETGDKFVERIEGSLTNVMGLPMELVSELLEKVAGT